LVWLVRPVGLVHTRMIPDSAQPVDPCYSDRLLEAAVAVLGADRIVFGSDFPIQGLDRPRQSLAAANLDEVAREAIRHGNAEEILHE
ncbi:MAG: amidohydrolase family protein, partial [Dehalococcoidia bacterium]